MLYSHRRRPTPLTAFVWFLTIFLCAPTALLAVTAAPAFAQTEAPASTLPALPAVINTPVMIVWTLAMLVGALDAIAKNDGKLGPLSLPTKVLPWILLVVGLAGPVVASLASQATALGAAFSFSAQTVFPAIFAGVSTYLSGATLSRGITHMHWGSATSKGPNAVPAAQAPGVLLQSVPAPSKGSAS